MWKLPKRKPARYPANIHAVQISVKNLPRNEFRTELEALPFLVFEVERISDGRTVCITKPGGKSAWGHMKIHDFMVWIYDPAKKEFWRISHKEIYDDLVAKIDADQAGANRVIKALDLVYQGAEPDEALQQFPNIDDDLPGQSAEVILKVYKWIWGQEDCNYPTGKGRAMSMTPIRELLNRNNS